MGNNVNPIGTEFQVNANIFPSLSTDGTQFSQEDPSIATLTDGPFAVVYESHVDPAFDAVEIHYAFVNANGSSTVLRRPRRRL
jgi:hypothetical protein